MYMSLSPLESRATSDATSGEGVTGGGIRSDTPIVPEALASRDRQTDALNEGWC